MRNLVATLFLMCLIASTYGSPMPEQTKSAFIKTGVKECLVTQRQYPTVKYVTEAQLSEYCDCTFHRAARFLTLEDLNGPQTEIAENLRPIMEKAGNYCRDRLAKKWGANPAYEEYVKREMEKQILVVANQITQDAPQTLDAETRLDGAVAGPGMKLTILYTLPNVESGKISPRLFDTKLAPTIKSSQCSSSQMKSFIEHNIPVFHEYRGKDGVRIGIVEVSRLKCGFK